MTNKRSITVDAAKLKRASIKFKEKGLSVKEAFDHFLDYVLIKEDISFLVSSQARQKQDEIFLQSIADILSSQCEYIYYISIDTNRYREYVAKDEYQVAGVNRVGDDWFKDTQTNIPIIIHEDDQDKLKEALTKESIIKNTEDGNVYSLSYRMITSGEPIYYSMRLSRSSVDDTCVIAEVRNIQKQYEKESNYRNRIKKISEEARLDSLTNCFNYLAFAECKALLQERLDNNKNDFAIAMCDLNDLKVINDTLGHLKGDEYLIESSNFIKTNFCNSKVYRIGGDEFIVVLEYEDFNNRNKIVEDFKKQIIYNKDHDKPVIAIGLSNITNDKLVDSMIRNADIAMYLNKRDLKGIKSGI